MTGWELEMGNKMDFEQKDAKISVVLRRRRVRGEVAIRGSLSVHCDLLFKFIAVFRFMAGGS